MVFCRSGLYHHWDRPEIEKLWAEHTTLKSPLYNYIKDLVSSLDLAEAEEKKTAEAEEKKTKEEVVMGVPPTAFGGRCVDVGHPMPVLGAIVQAIGTGRPSSATL